MTYKNKILVLGGTNAHIRFVEEAKKMGIYSVVTDYYKDSPAKKVCDKSYDIDINDIENLAKICKKENINGIVSAYIDPAQIPYVKLCNKLNLPCYGTKEQFYYLTNKIAFKQLCKQCNLKTIPGYTINDVNNHQIKFPVFVKPADSRGSRGQSICNTYDELNNAINYAKMNSISKQYIIEQYFDTNNEFILNYFVINGKPYFLYLHRMFTGTINSLSKNLFSFGYMPSVFTNLYLETTEKHVLELIQKLNIQNGPIIIEGLIKNNEFYFFDPGFRFTGSNADDYLEKIFNIKFTKMLIEFSINGKIKNSKLPNTIYKLNGNYPACLFPILKPGKIKYISDLKLLQNIPFVDFSVLRRNVGDLVESTKDVRQWLCEIYMCTQKKEDLIKTINRINKELKVIDTNDNDMILDYFNTESLKKDFNMQ